MKKRIDMEGLVRAVFDEFHSACVEYAILRNYEGLPEDTGGHDIDLVISRNDYNRVHEIFSKLQHNFDIEWVRVGERQYIVSYYLIISSTKDFLQIDLFFGQEWHGRTLISANQMLRNRRKYNDYYILRPAHEAADSLFSSLIRGGFYKRRYHDKIKRMLQEDEAEARKVFVANFEEYADALWTAIMDDDLDKCEHLVPMLRKKVTKNSLRNNFAYTCLQMLRFVYWEIRNRRFYSGLLIYVLGVPDSHRVFLVLEKLVYKYFKNEDAFQKYIYSEDFLLKNCRLKSFKTYYSKVQKKLNKTYAIIITGKPDSFRHSSIIKKSDFVIDYSENLYTPNKKNQVVLKGESINQETIELELINAIKKNDHSRCKNFILWKEG